MDIKKAEEVLEKLMLPADERFERLSRMLGEVYVGLMNVFSEGIGWGKTNEIIRGVVKQLGFNTVSEARKRCNIKGRDARNAFAAYSYSALNMTANWDIKVLEYTSEKVKINCSGPCLLYSAAKKLRLEKKVDVYGICFASHSSIIRAVNPELDYSVTKSMCSGNDICEFIIRCK